MKVVPLKTVDNHLQDLDAKITKAINDHISKRPTTAAEVAGVMRAIEFRLFIAGEIG
jgi:hypothetical protein